MSWFAVCAFPSPSDVKLFHIEIKPPLCVGKGGFGQKSLGSAWFQSLEWFAAVSEIPSSCAGSQLDSSLAPFCV